MNVLVTGGAGFIGSHTVIELLNANHSVTVVDNLSNASYEPIRRIESLTGKSVVFHEVDIMDRPALNSVVSTGDFDSVIHFAALKAVGESVSDPLRYYTNNIAGTLVLCDVLLAHGVKNLVFSSSATVYGDPDTVPITESSPLRATNPYGRTKLMMEYVLTDLQHANPSMNVALLRYFNPIGAHESGAVGQREAVRIMGDDYPTPDGTGVRDYIHVVDLARGHLLAIDKLAENPGLITCNLGTGRGYSVREVVAAFSEACGKTLATEVLPRRPGDVATCYADPSHAKALLGWSAQFDLADMCRDAWRWQSQNPNGYQDAVSLTEH
jgi:UDP-glucose 4-epimerase